MRPLGNLLSGRLFPALVLIVALAAVPQARADSCSIAQPHPLTAEQIARISGKLDQAETLYRQKLTQNPKDAELTTGLVRTLLAEEKIDEANSTVNAALVSDPQSPVLLTALAEVQYRQGLSRDEEKTLNLAQAQGVCYARLHLVLSDYYRFNSYYGSAFREIATAQRLDPYDPDIQREWIQTLPLEQRIDRLKKYLAANDIDVESIRQAQYELTMLQNLLENQGKSCHLASPVTSTDIDFAGIMVDAERVRGWGLDVAFNGHKARLQIDTGASGLYISRSVAEHAGLKSVAKSEATGIGDKGAQTGYTAYADSIKIGALEFRNCAVQVSDRSNVVDTDGLIGMDVFSNFLVTLDFPRRKVSLSPLPPYPGDTQSAPSLNTEQEGQQETKQASSEGSASTSSGQQPSRGPHDRYIAPEMQKWTRIYRVRHDLIVPTSLNNKTVRLFIVDTGAFRTSISPSAAREVTKVHSDDFRQVKGISGNVQKVYSGDKIIVRFAGLQQETDGMISFDTAGISQNMGTEISGFLGIDLLHFLVLKIDYRDGLVDFEYSKDRGYQHER